MGKNRYGINVMSDGSGNFKQCDEEKPLREGDILAKV